MSTRIAVRTTARLWSLPDLLVEAEKETARLMERFPGLLTVTRVSKVPENVEVWDISDLSVQQKQFHELHNRLMDGPVEVLVVIPMGSLLAKFAGSKF